MSSFILLVFLWGGGVGNAMVHTTQTELCGSELFACVGDAAAIIYFVTTTAIAVVTTSLCPRDATRYEKAPKQPNMS